MHEAAFAELNRTGQDFPFALDEFDQEVRSLLNEAELAIRRAPFSNARDYRAKVMQPVLGFDCLHGVERQSCWPDA